MGDPFSAAASVAGLISLCGSASKLFYWVISSIADAPDEVKSITRSLYGMNIALCQLQNILLDLSSVTQNHLDDLEDIERLVVHCVELFSVVENQLKGVHQAGSEELTIRRFWHQVKHVFEERKMKDALARLEIEKGTLHLLLNALNSKSLADVIRMVKNTEEVVGKNNHVLKSLELKVTRVLKDAMGRSHTTTSTISLDPILSQHEIERILTNSRSSLNLTLSDMPGDLASSIVNPGSRSFVGSASEEDFSIHQANIDRTRDVPPLPPTNSEAQATDQAEEFTSNSYSDTFRHANLTNIANNIAEQVIERLPLKRSPPKFVPRRRMLGSRLPYSGDISNPLTNETLGVVNRLINIARDKLRSYEIQDLYRARRRIQLYSPIVQFLFASGRGIENLYIRECGREAVAAWEKYEKAVQKIYKSKTDWFHLTVSLRTSYKRLDKRWERVERSMDDLEHGINMVLPLEVLQILELSLREYDESGKSVSLL